MAVDYIELFEDLGKLILIKNVIEGWRSDDAPDLDEMTQEAQFLFGEPTDFRAPEHSVLTQSYLSFIGQVRTSLNGAITNSLNVANRNIITDVMHRTLVIEGSIIPLSDGLEDMLFAIIDNMELDNETIDANVTAGAARPLPYDHQSNQGDAGVNAFDGNITVDDTIGLHEQLTRAGTGTMTCVDAGFDIQNAEEFALRVVTDDDGEDHDSPTQFFSGVFGTPTDTEDVDLNVRGQQVAAPGAQQFTGRFFRIESPDVGSVFEDTDLPGAWSGYNPLLFSGQKTPFNRTNCTFQPTAGARNGRAFLRLDFIAGDEFNMTWFADAALSIRLSEIINFDYFGVVGTQTHTWNVDGATEDLFDGLSAGDALISADADPVAMRAFSASSTVIIEFPLPWGEGDQAFFDFTSTEEGTFQTWFVRYMGVHLPSDAAGGETIPDSLAE